MSVFEVMETKYEPELLPIPRPVKKLSNINNETVVSFDADLKNKSRFGDDFWDYTDIVSRIQDGKFNFADQANPNIKLELKLITYYRIYHSPTSRSISSIVQTAPRLLARWASINSMSIETMLNDSAVHQFVADSFSKIGYRQRDQILSLVKELTLIRVKHEDFTIAPESFSLHAMLEQIHKNSHKKNPNQHFVIPHRILSEMINSFELFLKEFNENYSKIESFYDFLREGERTVHNYTAKLVENDEWSPLLRNYGLFELAENNGITSKKAFNTYLRDVQETAKYWIHLFSGMRDTEVNTLPYICTSSINTPTGEAKTIHGYTSKTQGKGATSTFWITVDQIDIGVFAAQNIGALYAQINNYTIDDDDYPLFPLQQPKATSGRFHKNAPHSTGFANKRIANWLCRFPELNVRDSDIEELALIDGFRDFSKTVIKGQPWPLSSHQPRRSLAVYTSHRISIGALQKQYKHLFSAMTSYYRNNSIFAQMFILNDTTDEFHKAQMAYMEELEKERRITAFIHYEEDVIAEDKQARLWGGEGDRIRNALKKGKPLIIATDAEYIEKKFSSGEMNYRRTPVGGCRAKQCDKVTISGPLPCYWCADSELNDNGATELEAQIQMTTKQRDKYSKGSKFWNQEQEKIDKMEHKLRKREESINE